MKTKPEIDMSEEAIARRVEQIRALYRLMKSFRECREALPANQRLG